MEFLIPTMVKKSGCTSGYLMGSTKVAIRHPYDHLRLQDQDTAFVSVKFSRSFV